MGLHAFLVPKDIRNPIRGRLEGKARILTALPESPNTDESYVARQIREFHHNDDGDDFWSQFLPGTQEGLYVVQEYNNKLLFDLSQLDRLVDPSKAARLGLTPTNVTLPIALCLQDPERYPSLSRARKEIRQGKIVRLYDQSVERAHVGDRIILPHTRWGRQEAKAAVRRDLQASPPAWSLVPPPFRLPVVYEDDHLAIVHKPAGVLVYPEGGKGRNNVRYALLHVLKPSNHQAALERPEVVHRLDFATSGLLAVAKTQPAVRHLSQQFEDRRVQKTYTAVVHGRPHLSELAHNCTRIIGPPTTSLPKVWIPNNLLEEHPPNGHQSSSEEWRLVETFQDGKEAVTLWKPLCEVPSKDGYVTVVQLRPKTGRYHQLRRHMAWSYRTPIVGDPKYSPGNQDASYRGRLLLCANAIALEHPYYNSPVGRKEWQRQSLVRGQDPSWCLEEQEGIVYLSASIALPIKFAKFLQSHRRRMEREP